jgi:hypothetical protein
MTEKVGLNVTAKQFEEESTPLVLDLIAVFSVMKEDVISVVEDMVEEGATPDQIIRKVEEMI